MSEEKIAVTMGMLGMSLENITKGSRGFVMLPLGPRDLTMAGGRKWVKIKVTAMEDVREFRDVIVGNDQGEVKEHTPVELSYEKSPQGSGSYQRVGEDFPLPVTFSATENAVLNDYFSFHPDQHYQAVIDDPTGAYGNFTTDFSMATDVTWRALLQAFPSTDPTGFSESAGAPMQKIWISNISYYLAPANPVTYELFLFSHMASTFTVLQKYEHLLYDSTAARVGATFYSASWGGGGLPVNRPLNLGQIYYGIDWSAAPGITSGFILVNGVVLR